MSVKKIFSSHSGPKNTSSMFTLNSEWYAIWCYNNDIIGINGILGFKMIKREGSVHI
jgi:hypothetical protein